MKGRWLGWREEGWKERGPKPGSLGGGGDPRGRLGQGKNRGPSRPPKEASPLPMGERGGRREREGARSEEKALKGEERRKEGDPLAEDPGKKMGCPAVAPREGEEMMREAGIHEGGLGDGSSEGPSRRLFEPK